MSQKMGIKLAGGGSGLSADGYSSRADLLKLNLKKGVLRMLNRLGLVIHWIGFIVSLLPAFLLFAISGDNNDGLGVAVYVALILISNGLGWSARFILTGHKGLMPWSKAKQP
jgi:hypothetical protein